MASFEYQPLSSNNHIRLLQVHSSENADLQADLVEFLLDDSVTSEKACEPFAALSYTWGSPERSSRIKCNGSYLGITSNLSKALHAALRVNPCQYLWVDQICINQDDMREKGVQVARMTVIYDRANMVIAWLGDDAEDTTLAVEWISKIASLTGRYAQYNFDLFPDEEAKERVEKQEILTNEESERLGVSFRNDAAWTAFSAFYDSPWFARAWIVQEALPIIDAVLVRGNNTIEWHKVKAAAAWYAYKARAIQADYQNREFDGIFHTLNMKMKWHGYLWGVARKTEQGKRRYRWHLPTLLTTFSDVFVTDPRDHVYALLGLSMLQAMHPEDPLLRPDYTKSVMAVFRDVTRASAKYESLDILLTTVCREASRVGWPTWVPDWQLNSRSEGCPGHTLPAQFADSPHKHVHVEPAVGQENKLAVRGRLLGRIIHCSEAYHGGDLVQNIRREHTDFREVCEEWFGTDRYESTGEHIDTAWTMTLHAGEMQDNFKRSGMTEEQLGSIFVRVAELYFGKSLDTGDDHSIALANVSFEPLMEDGVGSGLGRYMRGRFCLRRWVVTDSGLIALGYHRVEKGDVLVALEGLSHACVLRPCGVSDGADPAEYQLVGEAWCRGVEKVMQQDDQVSEMVLV